MCVCVQSATGVYLTALPPPGGIQIAGKTPGDLSAEHHILTIQKRINDTIAKNKELYEINPPVRHARTVINPRMTRLSVMPTHGAYWTFVKRWEPILTNTFKTVFLRCVGNLFP